MEIEGVQAKAKTKTQSNKATTNYGEHHPFCGGRCLVAKTESYEDNLLGVSLCLIVPPAIVCFVLVTPKLGTIAEIILDVILGILTLTSATSLLTAYFTEPGIVPTEKNDATGRYSVVRDGTRHELTKYRAKFCSETNNCIENFDHYCPWVGNAIGIRNYSYFFLFVLSTITLAIYTHAVSWAAIATNMPSSSWDSFRLSTRQNIPAVVLVVYTLLTGIALCPLFTFHVWLISNNQTTNENIKGRWDTEKNVHDLGVVRNWVEFWKQFGRRREWVVELANNRQTKMPPV